jgi:hypothetical protein
VIYIINRICGFFPSRKIKIVSNTDLKEYTNNEKGSVVHRARRSFSVLQKSWLEYFN